MKHKIQFNAFGFGNVIGFVKNLTGVYSEIPLNLSTLFAAKFDVDDLTHAV